MIDLLKLKADEAERIAYSEGFTMAAELFARIAKLEAERESLLDQVDVLRYTADDYREFFNACFDRLSDRHFYPSIASDHDKQQIFDAIERGEKRETQ
jgi:hypothetical protein